jgi:ABC-type lipoprotein export system ATPase subunit
MQILARFNTELHKTILMVTHDLEYLSYAKTAVRMFNGEIVGTYKGERKNDLLRELKGKRGNGD